MSILKRKIFSMAMVVFGIIVGLAAIKLRRQIYCVKKRLNCGAD